MVIMLVPTHFNHYNCAIVKDKSSLLVSTVYSLTITHIMSAIYSSAGLVENDQ